MNDRYHLADAVCITISQSLKPHLGLTTYPDKTRDVLDWKTSVPRLNRVEIPFVTPFEIGVDDTDVVGARASRADNGVGAPIRDFLGVSEGTFVRVCCILLGVDFRGVTGFDVFGLRKAVMKG